MFQVIKREFSGLAWNLFLGLRLAGFRRIEISAFRAGHDQVVLLVIFFSLVTFIASLLASLPRPEFNILGIANVATQFGLIFLSLYIISKVTRIRLEQLVIMILSIWPWFFIIWKLIGNGVNFSYWVFYGNDKELYVIYNIYFLSVIITAVARAGEAKPRSFVVAFFAFLVITFLPAHFIYTGQFWNIAYDYEKEMENYNKVNQEDTYYRQFTMLEQLKTSLLPSRQNVTDLYFIGFGSYASEDVFMKEIHYTKDLFDNRFDTKGRSVALINNYKTVEDTPLATKTNFSLVLKHIGKIINRDEDVVFVYLTSHGSEKHKLSVNLVPLSLNTFGPKDLKSYLDEAGIKWRVILVSACYSGGFVEPLKDSYTVIMTAAAKDKKSFGCGSKSDFTYFGNAVFREQLSLNFDFLSAFNNAISSIKAREEKEKRKSSNPQLYVGDEIKDKLSQLGKELEKFYITKKGN